MIARILPFATYLGFILFGQALEWGAPWPSIEVWLPAIRLWLYPVKIAAVMILLAYFWSCYHELARKDPVRIEDGFVSVVVGILVYVAWIHMDWSWAMQQQSAGYDPYQAGAEVGSLLAALRLFGAAMVVPVMEELFWRSFLLRYLVSPHFESVKLGALTPFAFLVSVALFGIEHDLWLAGMMAGAAYTILLYRTGTLWSCVVAHGTTNLALGVHVLATEQWRWW